MAAFRIHQDQENSNAQLRLRQKEPQNADQKQKRAVLGVLCNNVLRPNVQKGRKKDEPKILKQKPDAENRRDAFEIYIDSTSENVPQSEPKIPSPKVDLPETITALHRLPLHDIHEQDDSLFEENWEGSPMVVDKSVTETEVKQTKRKDVAQQYFQIEEYREDIHLYLKQAELLHRPKPNYMKKQTDITYSMRSILVDWLVEVAEEYKLQAETLYLAISYIDRFLSYMSVVRAKLQLVGTAAMFIAAKYEEIYPPDVGEFVYITDDTYTKKQVLRMEHLILQVLGFDLSSPTVLTFLITYTTDMEDMKDTATYLAMYISELSLLEGDPYLQFLPSVRAAAAIALARHTLSLEVWPQELQHVSGYKLSDLETCIEHLRQTFEGASTYAQQAVREKYKSNRWNNVSLLTPRMGPIC
ncbi:G2/mitotic-specific cyclin-A [Anabrus simplex]|uniref:G2/mitotic-specific cyclin-A n=1 Tax=Anabrus simplex TaxID=316456 RepID=UPI0034DD0D44